MNFKKSYVPTNGYSKICEVGKSSLNNLEFGMIELDSNEICSIDTEGREYAFIILSGKTKVSGCIKADSVGNRNNVFESRKAWSVYCGRNSRIAFEGIGHVVIAACSSKIECDTLPAVYPPENVTLKTLGTPPWERETSFLIDQNTNAKHLTVGEGYCTPGNWAGFPPHKHDTDNMPLECVAEEIYFFRFDPEQGFAVQCMYSDKEFDEAYRVKENDLVEFPKGYHTTVGAPGYCTYFLWMMAGEYQGFCRTNDPEHDWIK